MSRQLDFQGTIAALQALLGQVASVTIGNFTTGNEAAVAGAAGVLGYAERPPDEQHQTLGLDESVEAYTFFLGADRPYDRSWFTVNERSFLWGLRQEHTVATGGRVGESVTIAGTGTHIVVAVPSPEQLEAAGWKPDQ
jgi:hypothetical protein